VFDAGENLLHWWLTGAEVLQGNATLPSITYLAAGVCASIKWLGLVSFAIGAFSAKTFFKA
jgi:hypothetical protein